MSRFNPKAYQKDIFSINYNKLKKIGIKLLLFDFDNTIIEKGNCLVNDKTVELFKKLKKDFKVYVVSNSIQGNKVKQICNKLEIDYISNSAKPLKIGFKKLPFKDIKEEEIAMIGDQLITDIYGANRMNYYPILIDPINSNEWLLTKINRQFEKLILKRIKLERGKYYE